MKPRLHLLSGQTNSSISRGLGEGHLPMVVHLVEGGIGCLGPVRYEVRKVTMISKRSMDKIQTEEL